MKFDLDWLTDNLENPPGADELADRLTACGFTVELREPAGTTEVWDVEVTTNRPDAMNHRGLARELSVATGAVLRPLIVELDQMDEPVASLASVEIEDSSLCSRYVARVIRGVSWSESPEWLQARLERCGVRPLNAVVDATNYVLLELGQPLHAFDLARVRGGRIVIRPGRDGETLTTLDGEERKLDAATLVIADGVGPVALAGIMGGAESEISPSTVDVLLESAHFDPISIRRTARRLGLHTEASHRFERHSDQEMAATACDAAAALIARLTGGKVCTGRIDLQPKPWPERTLELSVERLSAFAGLEIDTESAEQILDGLEFRPRTHGGTVTCTVPPFRRGDVELVEDLYEEVIRHVGYDRVPSRLPVLICDPGRRAGAWPLVDRAREAAMAVGLTEVVNFSFIAPEDDALVDDLPLDGGSPLELDNPLARGQAVMRRSLLPGLLAAVKENLNRGETDPRLFEQGRAFFAEDGACREVERLGMILSGSTGGWSGLEPVGYHELKGLVEETLRRLAFPPVSWRRGGSPWLDESEGALVLAMDGRSVGIVGLLSAPLARHWQLKQPVYLAELDLSAAPDELPLPQFEALARFPSVIADMTLEHAATTSYERLATVTRELASSLVERVELVARFSGAKLGPDVVRSTLRLVYRHPDRSLTQEEVNAEQMTLRARLSETLEITFA